MGVKLSIATETDTATGWLKGLSAIVSQRQIAVHVGPAIERLMARHFRSLGQNKKGWPSQDFWPNAASATHPTYGDGFVDVSCGQIGVRQQINGGRIKPVNAKTLTIPAAPEAYGKTPREFSNLQFGIVFDNERGVMRPCLMEPRATKIKFGRTKKDGSRSVTPVSSSRDHAVFWLCAEVNQQPHPEALPTDAEFAAALDGAVEKLMRKIG